MQAWAEGREKGMKGLSRQNKMAKEKIAIVVSQFNYEITSKMRKKALQHAAKLGAEVVKIVEVPGSFEIPLAAKKLLEDKAIEGVATIGTIIKGGTGHDTVIAHAIAKKLMDLSCEYGKPVSLGISGPNITWQQAEKRIDEYAARAVESVVKMLRKD